MLTPYDPNSIYYTDSNRMDVENKREATTLKRTNSDEPHPHFFTSKKVKAEHNTEPVEEVSLKHLKQYVGIVYPGALPYFNTGQEPVDFSTAYHFAAKELDLELIKLLVKFGAPVNGLDAQNENALMVACSIHKESCKIEGFIEQRSEDCIKELLDAECNPWQQNTIGISPMHLIASCKSVKLFKKLKELGYDLNTPLNSFGDTFLIYLCNSLENKNPKMALEIITCLVDLKCDLMQKNKFGTTPLEILVNHKILNADGYLSLLNKIPEECLPLAYNILFSTDNSEVFDELLKRGASIHTLDTKNKTPLYRAVEKLDTIMITYLSQNGANYQQQRPVDSIPLSEAPSPYELVEVKMAELHRIITTTLIQIKNQPILLDKKIEKLEILVKQGKDLVDLQNEIKEIQRSPVLLKKVLNIHMTKWEKFPSICEDFLMSHGNDDSKDKVYYDLMISYLLKGYRFLLQSEQNTGTSNEVMEMLEAFQILFKEIILKYEEEPVSGSEDESICEDGQKKLDLLDFISHFSKFFNAIHVTLSAEHESQKTCQHLSYLMELMEKQFATQNFDEEIKIVDESASTEDTPDIGYLEHTPEIEPLFDGLAELNGIEENGLSDDIPEAETGMFFLLQDESGEDVICKYI